MNYFDKHLPENAILPNEPTVFIWLMFYDTIYNKNKTKLCYYYFFSQNMFNSVNKDTPYIWKIGLKDISHDYTIWWAGLQKVIKWTIVEHN